MAATEFAVAVDELPDGVYIVGVQGEVDAATVARVEDALLGAAARARRLVVDLRRVGYIDSLGFTVLTRALDAVKERGGKFAVVCERRLADLFEALALDSEFHVTGELDRGVREALAQKTQTGLPTLGGERPWEEPLRTAREVIASGIVPPDDEALIALRRALDEHVGGER